jgi:O-antigen/teichoic acid export membrane protein
VTRSSSCLPAFGAHKGVLWEKASPNRIILENFVQTATLDNEPYFAFTTKSTCTADMAILTSTNRRVASNFFWSVVSIALANTIFFITNIYLARTLGVESFGLFTLAQAVTYYFWLAVDLGINIYGIREIARHQDAAAAIIHPLFTIRVSSGLFVFLIYSLTLASLELPRDHKLTLWGCGLYLVTFALYPEWIFKGLEKFQYIVFGSLLSSAVFVGGIFLFIKNSRDVALASLIWSLSFLFGSAALCYSLYRHLNLKLSLNFNFKLWLFHLRESLHFCLAGGLAVFYFYLPIFLLNYFSSTRELGVPTTGGF